MSRLVSLTFAILVAGPLLGTANAGVIDLIGDVGDGTIDVNDLPQDFSLTQLRVGVGGNNVRGLAPVFLFALPNVPSPAAITGAELTFRYFGTSKFTVTNAVPEFNADLFGIGTRSTPTVQVGDYFDGDASLSSDTLIQPGVITLTTAVGPLHIANSSLLAFIVSLYQNDGTPVSPYVAFRLNADMHLPVFSFPFRGYELASADNTEGSGTYAPRLTLQVVPEPGGAAILTIGLSAIGLAASRRRLSGYWRATCHRTHPGMTARDN